MPDPNLFTGIEEVGKHVPHAIPFVVGAAQKAPALSSTRLIEAVIIAAVTAAGSAAVTVYVSMPRLEVEIAHLKESQTSIKVELNELRRDVMNARFSDQPTRRWYVPSTPDGEKPER